MELAPSLLKAVTAAGSSELSDAAFNSLLQQADALIQQSITRTQQDPASATPSPNAAIPGNVDAVLYKSAVSGLCALMLQAAKQESSKTETTSDNRSAHSSRTAHCRGCAAADRRCSACLCLHSLTVSGVLEEAGWSAARIGFFLSFFEPLLPVYRSALLPSLSSLASSAFSASASSSLPQLLSASHLTDLYLRSSRAERIRQPVVFVRLSSTHTAAPLAFACSAEELQDLLGQVKEAVRAASAKHAEE